MIILSIIVLIIISIVYFIFISLSLLIGLYDPTEKTVIRNSESVEIVKKMVDDMAGYVPNLNNKPIKSSE